MLVTIQSEWFLSIQLHFISFFFLLLLSMVGDEVCRKKGNNITTASGEYYLLLNERRVVGIDLPRIIECVVLSVEERPSMNSTYVISDRIAHFL